MLNLVVVNSSEEFSLEITYANRNVEKYFSDYTKMQKKLPLDWVRKIKKHIDRLKAADTFGVFLSLGLGKPEQLSGYENVTYSLHLSSNVRLIMELKTFKGKIEECTAIELKGVNDYHGDKENWYIG